MAGIVPHISLPSGMPLAAAITDRLLHETRPGLPEEVPLSRYYMHDLDPDPGCFHTLKISQH